MHFVYRILLVLLFPFSYIVGAKNVLKPKFNPYCSTKINCNTVCSCQPHINCSLLPMDETTRNSILFYHNQIRNIQSSGEPQPSSLTLLEYDEDLEELSTCWAGRCSNEYSDCFMTPKFPETSQSVVQLILEGGETPSSFLWMQMMNYWLKQANSISVEAFNSLPGGREYEYVHNFAQLMSDNIMYIGCAWSIMRNLLTFVCTYGPRGPNPHERIYRIGKYCSFCPEKYECNNRKPFKRLCKRKTEWLQTNASTSSTKKIHLTTHAVRFSPTTHSSSFFTKHPSTISSIAYTAKITSRSFSTADSITTHSTISPISYSATTHSKTSPRAYSVRTHTTSSPTEYSSTTHSTSSPTEYSSTTHSTLSPTEYSSTTHSTLSPIAYSVRTHSTLYPTAYTAKTHSVLSPAKYSSTTHTTYSPTTNFEEIIEGPDNKSGRGYSSTILSLILSELPTRNHRVPILPKSSRKIVEKIRKLNESTTSLKISSASSTVQSIVPPQFELPISFTTPHEKSLRKPERKTLINSGQFTYSTASPLISQETSSILYLENYHSQRVSPVSTYTIRSPPVMKPPPVFKYSTEYSTTNFYEYHDMDPPQKPPPPQFSVTVHEIPITSTYPPKKWTTLKVFTPQPPITYFPTLPLDKITPPALPTHPEMTRYPENTDIVVPTSPDQDSVTPETDVGLKKSAKSDDGKDATEETSTLNLIIYLCIGIVFLIVGTGFFMLLMYTLRMSAICA